MNWDMLIQQINSYYFDYMINERIVYTALLLIDKLRTCYSVPRAVAAINGNIVLEWYRYNFYRSIEIQEMKRAVILCMPEEIILEIDDCVEYEYETILKNITRGD